MSISRRFFLRGTGATLALPLLPSLLSSREARAAEAPRPCYVHFATPHGGVWADRMFPALPATGVQTRQYAGREIRRFDLQLRQSGGNASLSPVLSGSSSTFTDALVAKMLVLRGLDVPWYLAHHSGGHLGNFASNAGNGDDATRAQRLAKRRTIDQVMAWSPAFYGDFGGMRERVLVMGGGMSYNYSNPATRTGEIQEIAESAQTPLALFDKLFPQQDEGPTRPPIVDRVYASYRQLRDSGRLSTADRIRLEDHMQRVSELQRRLTTFGSCTDAPRPTNNPYAPLTWWQVDDKMPLNPAAQAGYFQVLNDLVTLAFSCGVSRIAVMGVGLTFSDFAGDWHSDVAHEAHMPGGVKQGILAQAYQRFFSTVMVDLAAKLNGVDMGDGRTLLDNSLVVWTQECSSYTHEAQSLPVVTFGGAGGFLRTGQCCDYRNLSALFDPAEMEKIHAGLLWHQWLGTTLQAMGVPRSEWEVASENPGYPNYKYAKVNWGVLSTEQAYPEGVWSVAGEVLPWLRA